MSPTVRLLILTILTATLLLLGVHPAHADICLGGGCPGTW